MRWIAMTTYSLSTSYHLPPAQHCLCTLPSSWLQLHSSAAHQTAAAAADDIAASDDVSHHNCIRLTNRAASSTVGRLKRAQMSVANEHTLSLAGWHMFNVDAAILSSIALCQSVACKYCTYRCCMICGFIDRPTGSLSARCVIKQPCLSQHVMMMNRSVIMSASHASPLYLFTTTSSSSVSSSDASKQLVC